MCRREGEAPVDVLVAYAQVGMVARHWRSAARPAGAALPRPAIPGPPRTLRFSVAGRGERFEDGRSTLSASPDDRVSGSCGARARGEVQRQVRLDVEDLLARAPQVERSAEAAVVVVERPSTNARGTRRMRRSRARRTARNGLAACPTAPRAVTVPTPPCPVPAARTAPPRELSSWRWASADARRRAPRAPALPDP